MQIAQLILGDQHPLVDRTHRGVGEIAVADPALEDRRCTRALLPAQIGQLHGMTERSGRLAQQGGLCVVRHGRTHRRGRRVGGGRGGTRTADRELAAGRRLDALDDGIGQRCDRLAQRCRRAVLDREIEAALDCRVVGQGPILRLRRRVIGLAERGLQMQDHESDPLLGRLGTDLLGMQTRGGGIAFERPGVRDQHGIACAEAIPGDLFQGRDHAGVGILLEPVGRDLRLGDLGCARQELEPRGDLRGVHEHPRDILQ